MAQINNLTEDNVKNLDNFLKKLQEENNELNWSYFNMTQKVYDNTIKIKDVEDDLIKYIKQLHEKIDRMNEKINHIFGNHALINGIFKDLKM